MGKRLLSFLVICLCAFSVAFAQKKVTGSVIDDLGEPVVGASVLVKGTQIGAATDINGKFTINNVPNSSSTLVVSYIGMQTKEVAIKSNVKIELVADYKAIDDVMVIAYGTQKKSAFTGSAAIVSSEELAKVQASNVLDAMRGKASGVQIYTASGQPGTTPAIQIRGFNSINAGNAPLIVLDGSPYDGSLNDIAPTDIESMTVLKDAASTALYGARGGNGVILITTKAAKKGSPSRITVDAKWGVNMKGSKDYDRINNPQKYYEMYYKALNNYATNDLGFDADRAWQWANNNLISRKGGYGLGYNAYTIPQGEMMIGSNGKLNPNATLGAYYEQNGEKYWLQPDNWDEEIYHNSLRQEYTVSGSAASDRGRFYASANYLNHKGIVYNSDYERFTARMNADYLLLKWLRLGGNMSYSHFDRNYLSNEGESSSGNMFALHNIAPIYPVFVRDENKNVMFNQNAGVKVYDYGDATYFPFTRPYLGQSNPISDLLVDTQNTEGNMFNGVGNIDVYLPYDFTFTSINTAYLRESRYTGVTNPYFGQYASSNGIVSKDHSRTWSLNFQQRLDWHKLFGVHDIEVMLGHEYNRVRGYGLDYYMTNMFSQLNKELAGAVVPGSGSSSMSDYNTESWLARAMYNYDERYFAQGSVMRQASSIFHPDHRWGTFWSVGAGWLINKENWFDASWVDELKLKASYGENGNDNISGYLYTNRYSIENSNNTVSLVPSTLRKNELTTWEKNAKFNAGIDFTLFRGRLYGTAEFYFNRTTDMLSSVPYAPSYGYTSSYANVGNMINRGVEFDLHGEIIRTRDFSWTVYANMTTNHNEITKLAEERKQSQVDGHKGYSSGNYYYTEGLSRYTYYAKKYAGIYTEDTWQTTTDQAYDPTKAGLALYYKNKYVEDKNESDKIAKDENGIYKVEKVYTTINNSEADYYLHGDVLPDVYGGFGTSFAWKGFDLSVDFQYQIGGKVFDSEYQSLMGMNPGYGFHTDLYNAWSVDNPNSDIPRINVNDSYSVSTSDRFLTNASYLTLGNITLGYTLPKKVCKSMGLKGLRVYAVADNIYTWSKRKGLDPRQSITGGSSGTYYSTIRSISGGITLDLGDDGFKVSEPVQTRFIEREVVKEVPVVKEVVKEVAGKSELVQNTYVVTFPVNSSEIINKAEVDGIAKGSTVEVVAYASPEGNADANLALSQKRADAVAEYLKSRGINVIRISAKGADSEHANRIAIITIK